MRPGITILIIILAMLLISGAALAQSGGRAGGEPTLAASSGGGYQLSRLELQAGGTASGAGYMLTAFSRPLSSENGCCCAYLPCVRR